jgi:hypothetical protein
MKSKIKNKFQWHELINRKFLAIYIALALVFVINQAVFSVILKDREIAKAAGIQHFVSDSTGDDVNCDGLSSTPYAGVPGSCPWKTVGKVNGHALIPGDSVLFRRGDIFLGSLKPDYDGVALDRIVYSDYPNSDDPLADPPIIRKDPALFSYVLSIREGRHDVNITNLQFDGGVGCNQIIQFYYSGADPLKDTISNILIENVILNGPYWGIRASGGYYSNITMNNLSFPGITTGQWGIDFSNTSSSSDITISNTTINGTNQAVAFSAITGLDILNSTITGNTASAITIGSAVTPSSDISITDCDLSTNSASSLRLTGGAMSNLVLDHVIANNNAQHGINATAVISGINEIKNNSTFNDNDSTGISFSDISNLTITDTEVSENHNGVAGVDGIGFYGNTSNITLNRVTVRNNGQHGIQLNTPTASNIDIISSTFNGNGTYTLTKGNGISFVGIGDDATLTDVTASLNGGDGFNVHGTWTNVNCTRCTAEDNGTLLVGGGGDGDGFSYHDDSSGIMSYCISRNNKKSAVAHINNAQVEMYYNLFSNTTNGRIALVYLEAGGTGTYQLYNNVIYSGGEGLSYPSTLINCGATATIKNNIIFADGADASANGIIGTALVTEDYNIVYGADTLFTGAINHGTNSTIQSDPKFVNAAAYDFHIMPDSPAFNAGTVLGYISDFEGGAVPIPAGFPDIGAYELYLAVVPGSLDQYKSDGTTLIPDGAWTDEDTVVLKFQMFSAINPATLTPRIEVQLNSSAFSNVVTHSGLPVDFSGVPVLGEVTVSGLSSETIYHWQARLTNSLADNSSWLAKGGSPDFGSDTLAPSGYTISIDQSEIDTFNLASTSFTFAAAELGTAYNYTVTSSAGGVPVIGNGTVTSATQSIGGINVIGLSNGILTYSVTLTDVVGHVGLIASDTVIKNSHPIGGILELIAPGNVEVPCAAIDLLENNAIVKVIDWKFVDTASNEISFLLYDIADTNNAIIESAANVDQIRETGLQTNQAYTRIIKANYATGISAGTSPATCYTLANVPNKLSISQVASESLTLKLDPNDGNPAGTKYAIEEVKSHQYINGNGDFTAVPVWLTYEQWGGENGITVWGTRPTSIIAQIKMALTSGTDYDFAVMAENGDGIATSLSESISGSTAVSAPVNTNINQPPVVPPTNTNQPPVVPPPAGGEVPSTPPAINGNLNVPIEPEPGSNENINEPPEIPGTTNENTNQPPIITPTESQPSGIPIIGPIIEAIVKIEPFKTINEAILDNPKVEQASQNIVTPILITVAAVNTLPAVIILSFYLLPYLHLIFLEPLLLLFGKKRKKWGVVYNSLTKLPVDLALVRLYSKKTNQLVQTRVTDRQGRYIIIAKDPGKYYLSVTKPGFVSPSSYLRGETQDTKYIDLYHGEVINVTEKDAVLTANIPLDPAEKKVLAFAEVIRSFLLKNIRIIVSYAGMILALIVVLIIPNVITIGCLILHIIFFLGFRRFIMPAKPKSWGIVYDAKTKEPLGSSVIRIFDLKFNKLLETQVTDSKGRYSFLVGKNQYQMLAEKPGYQNKEVKPVDLVKKEEIVNLDVGLNKI